MSLDTLRSHQSWYSSLPETSGRKDPAELRDAIRAALDAERAIEALRAETPLDDAPLAIHRQFELRATNLVIADRRSRDLLRALLAERVGPDQPWMVMSGEHVLFYSPCEDGVGIVPISKSVWIADSEEVP
jgi:hypothetical protein